MHVQDVFFGGGGGGVHVESTLASEAMGPAYHSGSIRQNEYNPDASCSFSIQEMDVCSSLNLLKM